MKGSLKIFVIIFTFLDHQKFMRLSTYQQVFLEAEFLYESLCPNKYGCL